MMKYILLHGVFVSSCLRMFFCLRMGTLFSISNSHLELPLVTAAPPIISRSFGFNVIFSAM
jgi:hypothetical protein